MEPRVEVVPSSRSPVNSRTQNTLFDFYIDQAVRIHNPNRGQKNQGTVLSIGAIFVTVNVQLGSGRTQQVKRIPSNLIILSPEEQEDHNIRRRHRQSL